MNSQKQLLRLSKDIGRRKTWWGKRNAVLRWCDEVKKFLNLKNKK